jgi:hypothetical protein
MIVIVDLPAVQAAEQTFVLNIFTVSVYFI